jgi:hypothetical protein
MAASGSPLITELLTTRRLLSTCCVLETFKVTFGAMSVESDDLRVQEEKKSELWLRTNVRASIGS